MAAELKGKLNQNLMSMQAISLDNQTIFEDKRTFQRYLERIAVEAKAFNFVFQSVEQESRIKSLPSNLLDCLSFQVLHERESMNSPSAFRDNDRLKAISTEIINHQITLPYESGEGHALLSSILNQAHALGLVLVGEESCDNETSYPNKFYFEKEYAASNAPKRLLTQARSVCLTFLLKWF